MIGCRPVDRPTQPAALRIALQSTLSLFLQTSPRFRSVLESVLAIAGRQWRLGPRPWMNPSMLAAGHLAIVACLLRIDPWSRPLSVRRRPVLSTIITPTTAHCYHLNSSTQVIAAIVEECLVRRTSPETA